MATFDYEVLARCQYELLDIHNNSFPCSDPATHRVWWADYMSDAMLVCPKHFNVIYKTEVDDVKRVLGSPKRRDLS